MRVGLVPAARYLEVLRYLRDEPLADLSVSRPRSRLRWGVAVPGDEDHTIYVWLDALANYLTVSGWPDHAPGSNTSTWPANLHVIGKDIIRFHIVYWPAFLMAADLPLPQTVLAHAHWTMDHFKMSKSRGNVVDPIKTMHSVGPDAMRYYLMRMGGSLATDTSELSLFIAAACASFDHGWAADFSTEGLLEVYRKDLAGQLGNLLSRITSAKVAGRLASPSEAFHLPLKRNVELDALFTKVPGRAW